ncbi:MAG: S26 family signal peptidase [Pseudomonadota bacterium]
MVGENEYFFLGDNRSNSIDSRIRGTVRRAGIIGEVHPLRARFTSEPSDLVN